MRITDNATPPHASLRAYPSARASNVCERPPTDVRHLRCLAMVYFLFSVRTLYRKRHFFTVHLQNAILGHFSSVKIVGVLVIIDNCLSLFIEIFDSCRIQIARHFAVCHSMFAPVFVD